jgi:hypothetical protein
MQPSVIVWDLETVPDLSGFAAANDLVGKPDADIREALGNKFPKHIYHTIVCIGAPSGGYFAAGWRTLVRNISVGTVTIIPSGATINQGSSISLIAGDGTIIQSDGTNYDVAWLSPPVRALPPGSCQLQRRQRQRW